MPEDAIPFVVVLQEIAELNVCLYVCYISLLEAPRNIQHLPLLQTQKIQVSANNISAQFRQIIRKLNLHVLIFALSMHSQNLILVHVHVFRWCIYLNWAKIKS